jgi:hypothetical protein
MAIHRSTLTRAPLLRVQRTLRPIHRVAYRVQSSAGPLHGLRRHRTLDRPARVHGAAHTARDEQPAEKPHGGSLPAGRSRARLSRDTGQSRANTPPYSKLHVSPYRSGCGVGAPAVQLTGQQRQLAKLDAGEVRQASSQAAGSLPVAGVIGVVVHAGDTCERLSCHGLPPERSALDRKPRGHITSILRISRADHQVPPAQRQPQQRPAPGRVRTSWPTTMRTWPGGQPPELRPRPWTHRGRDRPRAAGTAGPRPYQAAGRRTRTPQPPTAR